MVLGFSNFFGLSEAEYRGYLKGKPTDELKRQELARTRGEISACFSLATGLGLSFLTMGGSLAMSGVAARKARVSARKLRMIKDELDSRDIDGHSLDWKDFAIPIVAGAIGTGTALGADFGIGNILQIAPVAAPGGGTASQATATIGEQLGNMFIHPFHAVEGLVQGFVSEPHVLFHSIIEHTVSAFDPTGEAVSQVVETSGNLAQEAAFSIGAHGAAIAEHASAGLAAQWISTWISESVEHPDDQQQMSEEIGCSRLYNVATIMCNECKKEISNGTFKHCCRCDEDNYDLCFDCYEAGKSCKCGSALHSIQHNTAGEIYNPARQYVDEVPTLMCNVCRNHINQGLYYQCLACNSGDFDLCFDCYLGGQTCGNPQEHELRALLWAYVPEATRAPPYEHFGHGSAECAECSKSILQGSYFHCNICDNDAFDLCHHCYAHGARCHDSDSHVLTRHSAYIDSDTMSPDTDVKCIGPGCRRDMQKDGKAFSCIDCENDELVLCMVCYGMGIGCSNKTHVMKQITFTEGSLIEL